MNKQTLLKGSDTAVSEAARVFSLNNGAVCHKLMKSVCIIHLNSLLLEAARNTCVCKPWNASLCFSHHQWSHVTRVWNQVGPEEVSAIWQVRWSGIWRSDWKQWRLLWQVRLLQTNSPSLLYEHGRRIFGLFIIYILLLSLIIEQFSLFEMKYLWFMWVYLLLFYKRLHIEPGLTTRQLPWRISLFLIKATRCKFSSKYVTQFKTQTFSLATESFTETLLANCV